MRKIRRKGIAAFIISILLISSIVTSIPTMPVLAEKKEALAVHSGQKEREASQVHASNIDMMSETALPEKYDSREAGIIPSDVRNQLPHGICWGFAGIAMAEASMIKKGLSPVDNTDLSEYHLVFHTYRFVEDPLGGTKGDNNYKEYLYEILNQGSVFDRVKNTLIAWMGVVPESVVPLSDNPEELPMSREMAYGNRVGILKNVMKIPKDDLNAAKRALMDYGALGMRYHYTTDERFYNPGTAAQYINDTSYRINHAVALVGWDDTFSRENFTENKPASDGAWLIRNSWGEEEGEGGYFWISYEDVTINQEFYAFEMEKPDMYDHNYQYDGAGADGYNLSNGSRIEVSNVFQAKANPGGKEVLKAVSFQLDTTEVDYTINIYKNLTNPGNPTSGTSVLETPVTGRTSLSGYYTIDLNQEVLLEQDETFSVVIRFSKSGQRIYVVCEDDSMETVAAIQPNQSFYRLGTSGSWTDMAKDSMGYFNLRIKAFTSDYEQEVEKPSHEHSFKNEWNYNETHHWHDCTGADLEECNPTDIERSYGQHRGGEATCKEKAICEECQQFYGETVSTNHKGEIEIRDRKTATETELGYTGDTYCIDCGQIIVYGEIIPKLPVPEEPKPEEPKPEEPKPEEPKPEEPKPEEPVPGASDNNTLEGIGVTGIENVSYTGKKITFPNIQVFDGEQLLKEKIDYTISYKNNKNAYTYRESDLEEYEKQILVNSKIMGYGDFNAKKAPHVIIKMKGNYAGKKQIYFNIYPLDLSEKVSSDMSNTFIVDDMYESFTGKKQTPSPVVIWEEGGRNLKFGRDFEVEEYRETGKDKNAYKAFGEYSLTIKGKGNFTGKRMITYTIVKEEEIPLNKVSINVPGKAVDKNSLESVIPVLKYKGIRLIEGKDYTREIKLSKKGDKAYIILTGTKGADSGKNFQGTRRLVIKLSGASVSTAKIEGNDKTFHFTGKEIRPFEEGKLKVTVKGKLLDYGSDYKVTYEKNIYHGIATALIMGNPEMGYTGSKRINFKIEAVPLSVLEEDEFSFQWEDSIDGNIYTYVKGGVKPAISLFYKGRSLREGVDYILSYRNNKMVGNNSAVVVIQGKGDFTGRIVKAYTIIQKDVERYPGEVYIDVKDQWDTKNFKQKFKVVDCDGKALSDKKDYRVSEAVYTLLSVKNGVNPPVELGEPITDEDVKLPEGSVVEVKVTLRGEGYAGDVKETYRIIKAENDISKIKIKLLPQEYTGEYITVSQNHFTSSVSMKNGTMLTLEGESPNLEIVRYQNNLAKGTAKVTFRGIGESLGGYKTVTFTITPRTITHNWKGTLP